MDGWAWYDQLLLFGGAFLLIVGIVGGIWAKRKQGFLYIYISDYEFGTPTSRGYPTGDFGTLWLRLHIHFSSPLPISIDSVMLNLFMGKYIFPFYSQQSVEWEPGRIRTKKRVWSDQSSSYCHCEQYFYFNVPSLDRGEGYRVRIVAKAKGKEWDDEKSPIFFPTII